MDPQAAEDQAGDDHHYQHREDDRQPGAHAEKVAGLARAVECPGR